MFKLLPIAAAVMATRAVFAVRKVENARFNRHHGSRCHLPPMPPMPFIAPMRFIIFIMPPPLIFFIMSRICSN